MGLLTAKHKELLRGVISVEQEKAFWNKFLNNSNDLIAKDAFQLWNAYHYGKPLQPVAGDSDGGPIHISFDSF